MRSPERHLSVVPGDRTVALFDQGDLDTADENLRAARAANARCEALLEENASLLLDLAERDRLIADLRRQLGERGSQNLAAVAGTHLSGGEHMQGAST